MRGGWNVRGRDAQGRAGLRTEALARDGGGCVEGLSGQGPSARADAQQLAELIEARKVVPIAAKPQPRRVGSRPRTSEPAWSGDGGWSHPAGCRRRSPAQFTMAEARRAGRDRSGDGEGQGMPTDHRPHRGAGRLLQTDGAQRRAPGPGRRAAGQRGMAAVGFPIGTEPVRIVSPEWLSWLRLAVQRGRAGRGGSKTLEPTHTVYKKTINAEAERGSLGRRAARNGPAGHRPEAAGPVTKPARQVNDPGTCHR